MDNFCSFALSLSRKKNKTMKTFAVFLFVCVGFSPKAHPQNNDATAPPKKEITGSWEVWISGTVGYVATENDVYRHYTSGAAMNALTIQANGSYQWGEQKGKLRKTEPWYADPEKTYYQVCDSRGNQYDMWYKKDTDQLILMFGESGGHAATASRIGKNKEEKNAENIPKNNKSPKPEFQPASPAIAHYVVNEKVEINWSGGWYKGTILEIKDEKYKVNYEGWGSLYDEWVGAQRLKKRHR